MLLELTHHHLDLGTPTISLNRLEEEGEEIYIAFQINFESGERSLNNYDECSFAWLDSGIQTKRLRLFVRFIKLLIARIHIRKQYRF